MSRFTMLIALLVLAGCSGAPTVEPTVEVATPAEVAETTDTTAPRTEAHAVPKITSPVWGAEFGVPAFMLEGTGESGATLTVIAVDSHVNTIGTVTVGPDGHWALEVTAPLGGRVYRVQDVTTGEFSQDTYVIVMSADVATKQVTTPTAARLLPTILFAESPDAEPAGIFTTDTKEIFALITYENMAEGMVFRREWWLNAELWIEKEEAWDFAKYGSDGVITDISIHDGLPEGYYQLQLYIDGQQQTGGYGGNGVPGSTFTIRHKPALWENPLTSPDGKSVLSVQPPGRIVIRQGGGAAKTLVEADWIYEAAWFPDSTHFVYTNLIGEPDSIWLGIEHDIRVVNVADGSSWAIEYPDNDIPLRELQLSPDGRAMFVLAGVPYGDAEGSSGAFGLFIVLDNALKVSDTFFPEDFSGLTGAECTERYVTQETVYNRPIAQGEWAGPSTFHLKMRITCGSQDLSGTYAFDMDTLTAARVGP